MGNGNDSVNVKFFNHPGAGLDFSISSSNGGEIGQAVATVPKLEDKNPSCGAWASNGECANNPAFMLSNCAKSCYDEQKENTTHKPTPSPATPSPSAPPTPTPPAPSTPDGSKDEQAVFMGEVIANAKMLCTIVDAIDCWQQEQGKQQPNPVGDKWWPFPKKDNKDKDTDAPSSWWPFRATYSNAAGASIGSAEPQGVHVTSHRGSITGAEAKFIANPTQLIGHVRKICKVIDNGVDTLPGILEPLVGDKLRGILKEKLGDGLMGQIGVDVLDKLLKGANLDFMDIFAVEQVGKNGEVRAQNKGGRIAVIPSA